ncbi:MAG: IS5 family transposase [Verrucomicrobiota bacterium JB022]|nr:IS5 family transposase [Verrucomicrobiota bacterium JB022]
MRGKVSRQLDAVALINLESLIPAKHPIRRIKQLVDAVLVELEDEFEQMYAELGRPSIPPERLLKAKVLCALYSVRSDRQFCERLRYDLLFQWFLDLNPSEGSFNASTFSKNADRLLRHHASELFLLEVVELARSHDWISDEHFSVDGTLIEAWASMKSFRPKDEKDDEGRGPGGFADFKGQKRSNQTHGSKTDPEAKLLKKSAGSAAQLCFGAHAVMENRHGLCVLFDVRSAVGKGCTEHEVALEQLDELTMRGFEPRTVGADRGYHNQQFVRACREREIAPHVAQVKGRRTPGLDGRTTRHPGYRVSQRIRKRIENLFGWIKTTGAFRKTRYRGVERTHFQAQLVAAACNLVRMAKLLADSTSDPPRSTLAAG